MCTRIALEVREHLCAVSSLPLPLTGRTGDWSQVTGSAQQGLLPTEPHCQSSWIILLSIKPVLVHRKPGGLLLDLVPCSGLWVLAHLTFLISPVTFPCNKHVSALSEPVPIISPAKLFFLIYPYFVSWFVFLSSLTQVGVIWQKQISVENTGWVEKMAPSDWLQASRRHFLG